MNITNKKLIQVSIRESYSSQKQQNFSSDQSWKIILSTAVEGCYSGDVELDYSFPSLWKS